MPSPGEVRSYFGASPIIEAWLDWQAGRQGQAVATGRAVDAAMTQQMAVEPLAALSDRCVRWGYQGHWREAMMLHQLLVAIYRADPQRLAAWLPSLAVEHLRVATQALWHEAQPDLYAAALQLGQQAWDQAGPDAPRDQIARELGLLHQDPYVSSRDADDLARWLRGADGLPDPAQAHQLARQWLERALALRTQPDIDRLELLKALLQGEFSSPLYGGTPDEGSARGWLAQALPLLPLARHRAELVNYVSRVAQHLGVAPAPAQSATELLEEDIDSVDWHQRIEQEGVELVANTLLAHLRAERPGDRKGALARASRVEWVFETRASEGLRQAYHRVLMRWLLGDPVQPPAQAGAIDQALARLAERASIDEVFEVMGWVCHLLQQEHEAQAISLLDQLCDAVPGLRARWGVTIDLLRASLVLNLAVSHLQQGQTDQAALAYLKAGLLMLKQRFSDLALEMIDRLLSIVPETSSALVQLVSELLREQAPPWQPQGMHERWQQACNALVEAGTGPLQTDPTEGGWLALMRLAKGVDYSNQVRAQARYAWRDDATACALMQEIDALSQAASGEAPRKEFKLLFEQVLVARQSRPIEGGGDTPGEQRDNLARRLDEHVRASLGALTAQDQPSLTLADVKARLPPDAVLLDLLYPMHAQSYGYILAVTGEGARLFGVQITEQLIRGVAFEGDTSDNLLDHAGAAVSFTRSALAAEPPEGRALSPEAARMLEVNSRLFLGQALEWLADQHVAGKRQLIIVPDGATHFLPFHLLGLGGVPLAEHWTVSYLPSLDLLCREATEPPARQGAEVFGLGYEGTWAQPGLPPLDGAPVEAAAVARVLGVAPVPEAQATPERVLAALSAARYVHLACHGDHDVVAAVLQRLRLTGGPLLTLDLLALDLRGLAVLGLSACETALGRVDQGGNPMGLVATALAGGVPCVVSALWPVADDTSTVFFVLLFDALAKGKAPREAFRHAQTETRLRYPAYRDWGAFSLSGAVLPL